MYTVFSWVRPPMPPLKLFDFFLAFLSVRPLQWIFTILLVRTDLSVNKIWAVARSNIIFRDAFLEGDFSGCVSVARAINNLQGLYGCIPNVIMHGRGAKAVSNALQALNEKDSPKKKHHVSREFYVELSIIAHECQNSHSLLHFLTTVFLLVTFHSLELIMMITVM